MAIEQELPSTPEAKAKAAALAVSGIEKQWGKGSITTMAHKVGAEIPHIPTGLYGVDNEVIGCGGFPRGRIIEVFGPESCIDGDSFIQYEVRIAETGTRINHKGGTISRLYDRFHNLDKFHLSTSEPCDYYAPCVNEDGGIFQNKIEDVVKTGSKECWIIETEYGQRLIATPEHKFLSNGKYLPLSELSVGDLVSIHNRTPYEVEEYGPAPNRGYVFVKDHGVAGTKRVGKYEYKRLARSRAVIEAAMNGMSYSGYISKLKAGDIEGLEFLPRETHVHHKDENALNDSIDNLVVITAEEHGKLHAMERHNNLRYRVVDARIAYIEKLGVRPTYDLRMTCPFNNYVAEGFVVHNSGKTTLALKVVGNAQNSGGLAAFVDVEHALDPTWGKKQGVDFDNLLISQPDYGEQALEITGALVESGGFDIVVVDSVAALVPKAELEGDFGDSHMGLQARLMSQAMRKLSGVTMKTNTALVFINQIREKIGVMFGSPETTSGGRALKFYASLRLDVRRIGQIKDGDVLIGNKVKIKAAKNKVGAPFRESEESLLFERGFDGEGSLFDVAVEKGVIEKSGSWFSYKGDRIGQGRSNSLVALQAANLFPTILKELKA